MRETTDPLWIRSYALTPRRLTEGGWVWLTPYEWRWQRPRGDGPAAIHAPKVVTRRAPKG
ncbi:hypothetical protein [Phenylobacterium zucineum]|uniref:hypothetical protein n=1 Tax=Phenylobacterium zucineum TaxID=284016 RepID=UPI0002F969F4|nr:hypothetical protein [Phenylobacterium zucineum]